MEGREDQRERLRAERQAAESRDAADVQRQRRLQYLIIGGFAAIAVIVALIVISQSGGGSSDNKPPSNVAGASQANSELQGIPQQGQVLGQSSAAVTVVEYGDPQCSSC
jgi:protein-disulfide isomerase